MKRTPDFRRVCPVLLHAGPVVSPIRQQLRPPGPGGFHSDFIPSVCWMARLPNGGAAETMRSCMLGSLHNSTLGFCTLDEYGPLIGGVAVARIRAKASNLSPNAGLFASFRNPSTGDRAREIPDEPPCRGMARSVGRVLYMFTARRSGGEDRSTNVTRRCS